MAVKGILIEKQFHTGRDKNNMTRYRVWTFSISPTRSLQYQFGIASTRNAVCTTPQHGLARAKPPIVARVDISIARENAAGQKTPPGGAILHNFTMFRIWHDLNSSWDLF